MTNTSLELSKIDALRPLARLVRHIQAAATSAPDFVIAGAQARDLLLKYGAGVETGRQTADVDFAFRVSSWDRFQELRRELIRSGDFMEVPKSAHKLLFRGALQVDIVPFGDIETRDRTIAWPPDRDFVMSVFGFREVFDSAVSVSLPEGVSAKVVSLPALALLKIEAWRERRVREPGKDAYDILLILRNYLDAGNSERLYSEFPKLLEDPDFDYARAGAYLLGNDIAKFLDREGRRRIGQVLSDEADERGRLLLVGDMRIDADAGLSLLRSLKDGFDSSG